MNETKPTDLEACDSSPINVELTKAVKASYIFELREEKNSTKLWEDILQKPGWFLSLNYIFRRSIKKMEIKNYDYGF